MQDTIETRASQLARQAIEPIDPATISFSINAKSYFVVDDLDMPLVWYLRDQLQLTGTKFGCGDGADCGGICSVLIDGKPARACRTTLKSLVGKQVQTIEGLGRDELHPLQQAWMEQDVPQCGYCDPAWLLLGSALIARNQRPSATDVARLGIVCRCGNSAVAQRAILSAAERMRESAR